MSTKDRHSPATLPKRKASRIFAKNSQEPRTRPMSTLLIPPSLEVVLKGLHESEIRCGIQTDPPAGGITAWIDYGGPTAKRTSHGPPPSAPPPPPLPPPPPPPPAPTPLPPS